MEEQEKYLSQILGSFLDSYGAGREVPGAGTAAANGAMIAAKLLRTVITRTLDKNNYSHIHSELREIKKDIDFRIYPRLKSLFQEDSDKFRIHMRLRRVKRQNIKKERLPRFEQLKCETLIPCVEIPLEIAQLSKDLSDYALYLVDYGFVAVRGDSTVALNHSASVVGGCIGIVNLNMLYYDSSDWTMSVKREVVELMEYHEQLNKKIIKRQKGQLDELDWKEKYKSEFIEKYGNSLIGKNLSFGEIEDLVYEMQRTLWRFKKAIWKNKTPTKPFQVLDPKKILEILGYRFEKRESLGSFRIGGKEVETAGVTDKTNKIVVISEKHPYQVQRFTLSHELAHVIMHGDNVIYRDGPINGTFSSGGNIIERQADKFATYFTMPSKLVKSEFKKTFGVDVMKINEETTFAFNMDSTDSFRNQVRDLIGFSKFLASAEFYDRRSFDSLATRFGMSESAMAIRLKELNLLEFQF